MASGKNKLEDFDEGVDDVSWSDIEDDFDVDDFDETAIDSGGEDVPESGGEVLPKRGGKSSRKARKKGSSGAMVLGIGAVCLAVGGYYFYDTSLSSSKKGLPSTTLADAGPENTGVMPVSGQDNGAGMTPETGAMQISSAPENQGGVPVADAPVQNQTPEVLTPMPETQALGGIELSSLDVDDIDGLPGEATGVLEEGQIVAADAQSGVQTETKGLEEEKLLSETEKPFGMLSRR